MFPSLPKTPHPPQSSCLTLPANLATFGCLATEGLAIRDLGTPAWGRLLDF